MARVRTSAVVPTFLAAFIGFAILSPAAAQSALSTHCPKTAEQYDDALKVLAAHADEARAFAEDNPLLLADLGFYQTELKAIGQCTPVVATVSQATR
jgi:hypothetical protein